MSLLESSLVRLNCVHLMKSHEVWINKIVFTSQRIDPMKKFKLFYQNSILYPLLAIAFLRWGLEQNTSCNTDWTVLAGKVIRGQLRHWLSSSPSSSSSSTKPMLLLLLVVVVVVAAALTAAEQDLGSQSGESHLVQKLQTYKATSPLPHTPA